MLVASSKVAVGKASPSSIKLMLACYLTYERIDAIMIHTEAMVRASAEVHGSYNNGRGVKRVYAHNVLQRYWEKNHDTEPDTGALAEKLVEALHAMKKPSDELKQTLVDEQGRNIDFDGRWGYRGMHLAGARVLEEFGLDTGIISGLAASELDSQWVVSGVSGEEIGNCAAAIVAAREVAGHFHSLEIWACNSD